MIADLKPYPAMKDSGGSWLGDVPEHWTTVRLKSSMNNIVEQTTERRGSDLYVALEHVESWTGRLRHAGLDVSFDSQVKYFRSGDILFGKLRPYLAKVTRPTSDGVCVGEFLVLRPRHSNATAPYMEQLLRSKPIIDAVNSSTFGAKMPRAEWQFMGGIAIVHPSLPEQAAIVRFLDHADRRIRRYIRAKHKLITLLEEQKQAIIHQTVTRGLDPNVRLKSSGVEWLGDVPEHWETVPLKRIAWFKSGAGFPVAEQGRQDSEIPFIKVSDMTRPGNEVWIELTGSSVSSATATRLGAFVFPAGSIIFPKVGGALLTNKRRLLRRPSCIDNNVMGCVVSEADLDYAFILLQQLDLGRLAKPGPVPAIGEGEVRAIKVVLPPTQEQVDLVTLIHRETANFDSVILTTKREISLLREYRTRLIADVVTGKLDVRETAAGLPDEVEEPEPFDETGALIDGEEEPSDGLDTTPEEAAV